MYELNYLNTVTMGGILPFAIPARLAVAYHHYDYYDYYYYYYYYKAYGNNESKTRWPVRRG